MAEKKKKEEEVKKLDTENLDSRKKAILDFAKAAEKYLAETFAKKKTRT